MTDTIIAGWNDGVHKHYRDHPPTDEEILKNAQVVKNDTNISHIYGTTLMAALLLPSCLIILHQGDGRCEVFYEDGTVEQPVPWDIRCEDTAVTSMCDDDAVTSIRHCVIDLNERNVIACYLGSDGVEDAYRDTYSDLGGTHGLMGGVHAFYKDLTCQVARMSTGEFEQYLESMLPDFSANGRFSHTGSGDDVSVAGIVDMAMIQKLTEQFWLDVKHYDLEEALFWKEDELRGKSRKHEILKKRVEEAKRKVSVLKAEQLSVESKWKDTEEQRKDAQRKAEQAKQECAFSRQEYIDYKHSLTGQSSSDESQMVIKALNFFNVCIDQEIWERPQRVLKEKERKYNSLCIKLQNLDRKMKKLEEKQKNLSVQIYSAEQELKAAEDNFDSYDVGYRQIEDERKKILDELKELQDKQLTADASAE